MTNQVYQATVEQLEEVLSPRVVSRSLKEGLRQVGRSPDDVGFEDLEQILKAQIYRQLQVTMPVTQAKDKIAVILDHIRSVQATSTDDTLRRSSPGLERQKQRLDSLRDALKPYNLYFEWPDVQKLRAQVQLLELEHDEGNEAPNVVSDAEQQLRLVEQKLEDQLVIQAREIGELETALEQVRTLGGPKVRRLENLLGQIRSAQERRQLAPAEVERSLKLARDLRKLMESSVFEEGAVQVDPPAADSEPAAAGGVAADPIAAASQGVPSDQVRNEGILDVEATAETLLTIDTAQLDPEVGARLLMLDVESERHDLDVLEQDHANLLSYLPNLRQRIASLRQELDAGSSVADGLAALNLMLQEAALSQRDALREELEQLQVGLGELGAAVDTVELRQALTVALGILSTTLPSESDVQHIRNLHRLVRDHHEEQLRRTAEAETAREARLREQAEILSRLETSLVRYEEQNASSPEYGALAKGLDALKAAQSDRTLDPDLVIRVRLAEEQLEEAIAQRSEDVLARERAQLRALLNQVEAFPHIEVIRDRIVSVQAELERQHARVDSSALGEVQIDAAAKMVEALDVDVQAALQQRLREVAERATSLGNLDLLAQVQAANHLLEQDRYPDLDELDRALQAASEARRAEQIGELHELELEAAHFQSLDLPENTEMHLLLEDAREQIDRRELASGLERAWALLDSLRGTLDERLIDFEARLDQALSGLERVAALNSDDVASARRILHHLDSQRQAFGRVSTGLKIQLETSLRQAENLLDKLSEEYEATRAIADQLVSANILDDVLGLFGGPDDRVEDASPEPLPGPTPASETAPLAEDGSALDRLLSSYLSEPGVGGVAAYHGDELLGGRLEVDPTMLASALNGFQDDLTSLGRSMELGGTSLFTLEMPDHILITACPTDLGRVVVILDAPNVLSLVLHKLRRDLDQFRDLLGGPALA